MFTGAHTAWSKTIFRINATIMNLALIFLLICTGVKGSEEEISRFFTNGHGGFQFYHAQEKYDKSPHKPRTPTTTEIPQEEILETTSTTVRIIPTTATTIPTTRTSIPNIVKTNPTTVLTNPSDDAKSNPTISSTTIVPATNPTTAKYVRIVGNSLRRRPTTTSRTSSITETTESVGNSLRRRPTASSRTSSITETTESVGNSLRRRPTATSRSSSITETTESVGNSSRRRPTATSRTSSITETTERTTRFSNLKRRRRPTTTSTTQKSESTIRNLIDSDKELNENEIKTTEDADLEYSVNASSVTEGGDFSTKFNRFYKKEKTTTEENNEILDVSTENAKKFAPKIYGSHFKLRRPTPRPATEKTNPKIKRHDVHVLSTNLLMEKRRKIYHGYIRKPASSTNSLTENTSSKVAVMINRKAMPKIQIANRNFTSIAKTNPTLLKGKDLYARKPSEKYMQLRQKEKPKVEDGISALRKRHLSSVNYFRQHAFKFS